MASQRGSSLAKRRPGNIDADSSRTSRVTGNLERYKERSKMAGKGDLWRGILRFDNGMLRYEACFDEGGRGGTQKPTEEASYGLGPLGFP
jgi:hypothetical protein